MLAITKENSWEELRQVMRDGGLCRVRRTLRYGRRLPTAITQLLRFKPASRKQIYLSRYHASWRNGQSPQFDIFAAADTCVSALLTNHSFGRRHVSLRDSPLYNFVISYQSGCLEGQQLYRTYLQREYGFKETDLRSRITAFENLIKDYITENATFTVAVRLRPDGTAFLLDGAHRASIVCAVGASDKIRAMVAL